METTLTPTLFHTQIGGHAHSLTHALSLSLSHKNSPYLNLSLTHLLTSHSHTVTPTDLPLSHGMGGGNTHSRTHALTHSLTHTHLLTHTHTHSFTHSHTHTLAHSLTH